MVALFIADQARTLRLAKECFDDLEIVICFLVSCDHCVTIESRTIQEPLLPRARPPSVICCRGRGWSTWIRNFQEFAGLSSMLPLSDSSAVGDLNSLVTTIPEFWSRTGSELEFGFGCSLPMVSAGFCWFLKNYCDSVCGAGFAQVLVRSGQRHQQLWRALITGPAETPYSGGCFVRGPRNAKSLSAKIVWPGDITVSNHEPS